MPARVVAFDFETALIRPGCLAPEPACLTFQSPEYHAGIVVGDDMRIFLKSWLDGGWLLVGANVAYDLGVAAEAWPDLRPSIFQAYEEDRITDVQIRDRLLNIARGTYLGRWGKGGVFIKHRYSLDALADRVAGMKLEKDAWRLSYSNFIGVPLSKWPERAREVQDQARETLADVVLQRLEDPKNKELEKRANGLQSMIASDPQRCVEYPLDDARATLAVYLKQEEHASYLEDQYRQARAYWALHLGSAWGIRTDAQGVEILRRETQAEYDQTLKELQALGLVRADGTRDTKAAKARMVQVCKEEGIPLRRTPAHDGCELGGACTEHVCLDEDACNATDDEALVAYASFSTLGKVLSNDVVGLSGGIEFPIHTNYGLAASGRTTSSKRRDG